MAIRRRRTTKDTVTARNAVVSSSLWDKEGGRATLRNRGTAYPYGFPVSQGRTYWRRICRNLWFLWIAVIIGLTTLPWSNYSGHPHWDKIVWIPFVGGELVWWEILGNVALFVPFGFLLAFWLGRYSSLRVCLLAIGLAGLLSGTVEYFQVFCHERFPSANDFCANLAGAVVGMRVAFASTRWETGKHEVGRSR